MKTYRSLMRVLLKENFSLKRLLGFDYKKEKLKGFLIGLAILYALAVFFGMIGYLFYDLGEFLVFLNAADLMLVFLASYAILFGVFLAFLRSNGYIFHYKDYPLLGSLPIHSKTLLIAKLSLMFMMIYAMMFLMSLPVLFAYFYWTGFSIIRLLLSVVGLLFLPIFPVLIGAFMTLLIARITVRFRYANYLNIIIMVVVLIGFMVASFSMSSGDFENPLVSQQSFMDRLAQFYLPLHWFQVGVHQANIMMILGVVALNALPIGLFVLLAYDFVNRTNQVGMSAMKRNHQKDAVSRSRSTHHTLVHKEMKRFFSLPIYVLNAGIGPLFLLIVPLLGIFYRSSIQSIFIEVGGSEVNIEVGILLFVSFSLVMVYTTAISLSLEGKNLWVLKSLPLRAIDIVFSKIIFNLYLGIPLAVFAVIALGITYSVGSIALIVMVFAAIVFGYLITVFDAVINLHLPKLDFKNEVEVIKQSASALFAIFGGFALIALNGVMFYFMSRGVGFSLNLLIISLVNLVLSLLLTWYIYKRSEQLIYAMKS